MILAYLLLLTGLTISAVAIYYSVVGLTAIFSAAVIPIIVMGASLEVAKLVCASWLKANWERAPQLLKWYMSVAVVVLMLITSMGIFGFLSKAHNDQNLVSGDVQSKIAIYDEKIKTARENIEADRKQLKQMDEAVDQTMARSSDEKGADKAAGLRRSQLKDRNALAKDIEANQKTISQLNDEAAPIRAEIRKVEAEVGPIKYIAKFMYGEKGADENMLEQAVTWIIILIVIVFDPLAVIMLLGAQMTFQWKKDDEADEELLHDTVPLYVADVGEKPTEEEKNFNLGPTEYIPDPEEEKFYSKPVLTDEELDALAEIHTSSDEPEYEADDGPLTDEQLHQIAQAVKAVKPDLAEKIEQLVETVPQEETIEGIPLEQWNAMIAQAEHEAALEAEAKRYHPTEGTVFPSPAVDGDTFTRTDYEPPKEFTFNGNQWVDSNVYNQGHIEDFESEDSKKKTYMIKDPTGLIQVKDR